MKRLLMLILLFATQVRADNILTLSSQQGHPSDTVTVSVSLANTDNVSALQMSLPLNASLTYIPSSCELNDLRSDGHTVSAVVNQDTLRIFVYSLNLKNIKQTSGELFSFKLLLGTEPATYTLHPTDVKLSSASGAAYNCTTPSATLTLLAPKIEIINKDVDFGHIPIRSDYYQDLKVSNTGNEDLVINTVSFDDDAFSTDFTPMTLTPGQTGSVSIKYSPVKAGKINKNAYISSNSPGSMARAKLTADPYRFNSLELLDAYGYNDSTVTIRLTMENMDSIVGLQTKIVLPKELVYQEGSFKVSDKRKTNHIASAGMQGDTLVLLIFSADNSPLLSDNGEVASFKVLLQGSSAYYTPVMTNTVLADNQGNNVLSDLFDGTIRIRSGKISLNIDPEAQNRVWFETTFITDTAKYVLKISNTGDAPLVIDTIIFTDDEYSVTQQLPIVINRQGFVDLEIIDTGKIAGSRNALMKIYSNDYTNPRVDVYLDNWRYSPNYLIANKHDTVKCGDTVWAVTVNLENYDQITALQFDFCYDNNGNSVSESDFVLTQRSSNHAFSVMKLDDRDNTCRYRVFIYSFTNSVFEGNEGDVMTVYMHGGATYVGLEEIIISDTLGNNCNSTGVKEYIGMQWMDPCQKPYVEETLSYTEVHLCDEDDYVWETDDGSVSYYTNDGYDILDNHYWLVEGEEVDTLYRHFLHLTFDNTYNIEISDTVYMDQYGTDYEQTTVDSLLTHGGCDSLVVYKTYFHYLYQKNFVYSYQDAQICKGSSYVFSNRILFESGEYIDTINISESTDSIVYLTLTVNDTYSTVLYDTIDVGEKGISYTDTTVTNLQSIYGCDSVVTTYTYYIYDSSIDTVYGNISATICQGAAYQFGDKQLNQSGVYYDTVNVSQYKDSIAVLTLEVMPAIENIIYDTVVIDNQLGVDKEEITVDTLQTDEGCDSLVITKTYYDYVNEKDVARYQYSMDICNGESYTFNGQNLTESGMYTDTVHVSEIKDSIVYLTLTVNDTYNTVVYDTVDVGEKGISYTDTTVTNLQSIYGCDSVVTTYTYYIYDNSIDTIYNNITATICQGATYQFGDKQLNQSGVYYDTVNINDYKDSITVLTLTVTPAIENTIFDTVVIDNHLGVDYETVTVDTLQTSEGCDSLVITKTYYDYVNEKDVVKYQYSMDICSGESYTFNGQNLIESGTYTDTIHVSEIKDSIVYLTLTVNDTYNTVIYDTIDVGAKGISYTDTTVTNLQSIYGCDSVVTKYTYYIYDSSVDTVYGNISATICQGTAYQFGDKQLNQSGVYYDTVNVNDYKDSITVLTLTVNPVYDTVIYDTVEVADLDEDYELTKTDTLTSVYGCDSIVTVVTVYKSGLEDIGLLQSVTIYPNPAHKEVIIDNTLFESRQIIMDIYDNGGRLVISGIKPDATSYKLNISWLDSGVYYIRFKNAGEKSYLLTKKLIVK